MKITKDFIDVVARDHGRNSCSDDATTNGYYEISEEKFKDVVISRSISRHPRCNRCFLLEHLDQELDPRLILEISISLSVKQPKVKVISEE